MNTAEDVADQVTSILARQLLTIAAVSILAANSREWSNGARRRLLRCCKGFNCLITCMEQLTGFVDATLFLVALINVTNLKVSHPVMCLQMDWLALIVHTDICQATTDQANVNGYKATFGWLFWNDNWLVTRFTVNNVIVIDDTGVIGVSQAEQWQSALGNDFTQSQTCWLTLIRHTVFQQHNCLALLVDQGCRLSLQRE